MKTFSLHILTILASILFLLPNNLSAQETNAQFQQRMKAIEKEEIFISNYIDQMMTQPCSDELYKEFIEVVRHDEHDGHHAISTNDMPILLAQFRRDYYRRQFMESHPEIKSVFDYQITPNSSANKSRGGALVCTNGTLEANLTGFNGANGVFTDGTGLPSACEFIQTTTQPGMTTGFSNISWVSNGMDPIAPIARTHNGSLGAARINSSAGAAADCFRNGRMNQLSMPFTPTMNGSQSISFSFALLLESPGHDVGTNPFFVARVINTTTGIEESRFCIESTPNNSFFVQANLHDPNYPAQCIDTIIPMQYVNWTCATLNFEGNVSNTYAIDFFVAGCHNQARGHFGYAYVDDICINCSIIEDQLPSVTLQPTDTCIKNMIVCANYTLPIKSGVAGTLITTGANQPTLRIYHNGVQVGGPITGGIFDLVNKTICFNISPANLGGATGGFDFGIKVNFSVGAGIVPASDINTNTGLNNDYTTNLCCSCGSWTNILLTGTNGTVLTPAFYTCGTTVNNRPIVKGGSYQFRFKFNCVGSTCTPTYTFSENINGVVTSTLAGGAININFVPNQQDCGLRSITVTPSCGGIPCAPCTICFPVTGCDECIEPVNKTITCDASTGKPVINFCLKNLDPVPVQFFGITIPTNVSFTTLALPPGAILLYTNPTNGMRVYRTLNPITTGDSACSFRFQIDGGIYKNQQLCIELKRFTLFDQYGNFLNCCIDPIPLCFTMPDCSDDCADIVNASISCNYANQRVLSFQVKNNTAFNLTGYESHKIGALPNDNFAGFFIPTVPPGALSQVINHIIPSTIPSGSSYCFTNTVHYLYYTPDHVCDTVCYSDTLCLTVPYCGVIGTDTIKGGNTGTSSTIGGGLGKSSNEINETSDLESTNLLIYPNPTDGMLYVESFDAEQGIQSIRLQDLTGREIYFKRYENTKLEKVDMQKFPSGMYIININDEKQMKVIKK